MFWRFGGYANISTLDSILDKPDVTLEELLDESDLIQELKAQNAKLIEFLREDSILERLLQYVIAPKSQDVAKAEDDSKGPGGSFFKANAARSKSRDANDLDQQAQKRTKYAFVSCEILSSEVYSIHESLLANPEYLREFWRYIGKPAPLDPIQAGYFTKVNEALLEKKTEDMITFIKTIDNVVADMMQHVDCPMIMDLLLKLISLEKEPEGQGIIDWLQSQRLIPMLLSFITPDHPAATQTSAGDFLKAIITISANATGQDTSVIGPNELTRQLVSEPCINGLILEMLKGGNPLTVGVGIVIEVIRKNNSDYDSEAQIGVEPRSSDPIYLGTLLRHFAMHISKFMELILSPRHTVATDKGVASVQRKDLKVAWGEKIEPLGFDRFKTCELMAELLHCSNMGLLNEKGSDAAIRARDAERDRLKEQGALTAAQQTQSQHGGFSASVDSSGFEHTEDFTPLGESPETVKRLEVQNNVDDEDFEKVAMPDSSAETSSGNDVNMEEPQSEPAASAEAGVTGGVAELGLDSDEATAENAGPITYPPRTSSKQPVSLLTQQLQAVKESGLSTNTGLKVMSSDDTPAPLFSTRTDAQEKSAEDSADDAKPQSSETIQESNGHDERGNDVDSQDLPVIEREDDGSSVIGDLLKIQFVDHRVVPTILDFFFRFPWNNFLHNVVYDVVQQVFNGSMDRGFNRNLAIDLFETGRITDRVIEGQQRSDKAQTEKGMRLGYMGHLTLIAEEVVKFTERQPAELLAPVVVDKVTSNDWIHYVEHTLTETRDRDNAILGGVRPDVAGGPRQAVLNAVNAAQGGLGNTGSAALVNAGLVSNDSQGLDSMDLANAAGSGFGLGGNGNLLSGFGSSDDEDDDEMEGSMPTKAGGQGQTQVIEEDQSTGPSASNELGDASNASSVPAPLAIPPSRARRQLAARLAEKKRLADKDGAFAPSSPPIEESQMSHPSVSTALASAGVAATAPASGGAGQSSQAAPTRARTDSDSSSDDEETGTAKPVSTRHPKKAETAPSHADDDDEDEDDSSEDSDTSDDIPNFSKGQRQTTRAAAPSERRPLDDVSSSSEEGSSDEQPRGQQSTHDDDDDDEDDDEEGDEEEGALDITPGDDLDVEDYWRLGELRQAAAERAAVAAKAPGARASGTVDAPPAGTSSSSAASAAERVWRAKGSRGSLGTRDPRLTAALSGHAGAAVAKQQEQERLLQQWGLANEDDEDEDDEPVEMGTKYLSRRASQGHGK